MSAVEVTILKNVMKTTVFSERSCCLGPALCPTEGRASPGDTPRVGAPSDVTRRDRKHLSPGTQGPSAGLWVPDAGAAPCRHPAVWPPSCQPSGPPGLQLRVSPKSSPLEKPLLGPGTIALPSRFFLPFTPFGILPFLPVLCGLVQQRAGSCVNISSQEDRGATSLTPASWDVTPGRGSRCTS